MNYGRAFSYITEDPEWLKKVGIAGLVSIIPLVGQIAVLGWVLEVTRHIINGEPDVLPDWSNFSDFLTKGFQAFVIAFAYLLPVIILNSCTGVFPVLVQNVEGDTAQTIATVISVVSICLSCVIIVYSIIVGLILPAAMGNFAATGQVAAGFRFGEIFGLFRAAPGPYIVVYLLSIVTGLLACLGFIACVIGVWFTSAYAYAINAHLWGQAYKEAKAAPSAMATPGAM